MGFKYFGVIGIIAIVAFFVLTSITEDQPEVSQCQSTLPSSDLILPENELYNSVLLTTANSIGELPTMDSETFQTFDQYKTFADTMNDGVRILNSGVEYDMSLLQNTQEGYEKASKIIVKYTPMVNSYNNMVYAAQNVDISDQNSVNCFYTRTAIFSVELTLISTAVYAGPSYKVVGDFYRVSGLQHLAFKCPSCVSTALSNAHWFVRSTFVETTSIVIFGTLNEVDKLFSKNFQSHNST